MSPFSNEIKNQINQEQDFHCARCGNEVNWMGPHHIIPENALKPVGIRGKNIKENGIGLCSGEWGRGENSPDDCHEVADQKAIKEHLFWHNGRFTDLSEIDPSTYIQCKAEMPKCRKKHKHHPRKR